MTFSKTQYTDQYMNNWSFDNTFKQNTVEAMVYNPITGSLDRLIQPGQTLPVQGTNPITALDYDEAGNLVTITKTVNSINYSKTLTYDGLGNLTDIGAWVQLS